MTAPLFTLERLSGSRAPGAFGVLKHLGVPIAVTLEHAYEQPGEPSVKIPPGVHRCTRTWFNRGGYWTYEIHVIGHDRLLFHKGNTAADSDGCVMVAESFEPISGVPGIAQSAHGFDEFMTRAAAALEFFLEVF